MTLAALGMFSLTLGSLLLTVVSGAFRGQQKKNPAESGKLGGVGKTGR